MNVLARAVVTAEEGANLVIPRRSTIYREMAALAVRRVLEAAGLSADWVYQANTGIVGVTYYGDHYPETWAVSKATVSAHQFGASVLNSIIGHCTLEFKLVGPQIMLVRGDPVEVAEIQLETHRAGLMLVYRNGDMGMVEALLLGRSDHE